MQTSPAVDGLAKRQMWELLEAALLEVHATFMQHATMRRKFVEQSARRIRKVATRCIVGCNPMHCWLQHDKLCTALLSACASSCPLWRCATSTGGAFLALWCRRWQLRSAPAPNKSTHGIGSSCWYSQAHPPRHGTHVRMCIRRATSAGGSTPECLRAFYCQCFASLLCVAAERPRLRR